MAGRDVRLQVRLSGMSRINTARKMNSATKKETTKKDFVSNANKVNTNLRRVSSNGRIIDTSNKGNRHPCPGPGLYPCGYEYNEHGEQHTVCCQYIPIVESTPDRSGRRPLPGGGTNETSRHGPNSGGQNVGIELTQYDFLPGGNASGGGGGDDGGGDDGWGEEGHPRAGR